jgi:thioredoxin reductase (NADPH)
LDRFETANVYYEATFNERRAVSNRWQSSAAETRPGRLMYFWQILPDASTSWCATATWAPRCRDTLADQISRDRCITVMTHTQIRELRGEEFLTSIVVEDRDNVSRTELAVRALFVFIGAQPQSAWLARREARRARVRTNRLRFRQRRPSAGPAGDIRGWRPALDATRRVAAAMAEGAIAVASVNAYLANAGHAARHP